MKKINKSLLVFLTALSGVSFADVSLYGKVAVGTENDQFQSAPIPEGGSVQDYGSYFGIRGTDPVYGETSVIWQVEQYLDIAAGQSYYNTTAGGMIVPNPLAPNNTNGYVTNHSNSLASSETYLGLQGRWGRIRMGNLSNYVRSNMGNTNMFNCANGANCLGKLTRTSKLVPTSLRYDSPVVGGFNVTALYGFSNNGVVDVTGVNQTNNYGGGLNGVYSGGILVGGIGYTHGNWAANLGTMIWQQVGTYSTGISGITPNPSFPNSAYSNAYTGILELTYNDPEGIIVNAAMQISDGLAWNSWANSGGTLGVIYSNPAFQNQANQLYNNAQLQTQEFGVSFGYHLGPWTPKIGYAYGNNMMIGGNALQLIAGNAQQIGGTGYQNAVAELDWNITPRTIAFVNFGQIWYGDTLQNVSLGPVNGTTPQPPLQPGIVNGNNQYASNQSTLAIGFSHTF